MPLNQLVEFEQRLEALFRDRGGARWQQRHAELDLELHRFIISHSGSHRLITYLENISFLPRSLRLAGYEDNDPPLDMVEEHLMIVRALLRRDGRLAERLLAKHIENGKRKMLESLFRRHALATNSPALGTQRALTGEGLLRRTA